MLKIAKEMLKNATVTSGVRLEVTKVLFPLKIQDNQGNPVEGIFLNPKDNSQQKYSKEGTTLIMPVL